ncbi:unnamed protein product [Citrullus colocynthis]|uniref:Uncharacterized protein n=1 Tax=Citrullus colocynthis TaxID=252529 RepID=A0ABP0YTT4_9ROSI
MASFSSSAAAAAAVPPPFYMEEKWKLPKKRAPARSRSSSSSCPLMRNSSERRCSFTRKCAKLVKEQRARFYIMRKVQCSISCVLGPENGAVVAKTQMGFSRNVANPDL